MNGFANRNNLPVAETEKSGSVLILLTRESSPCERFVLVLNIVKLYGVSSTIY